jgi:formate hydrogenlyase transcriptional activator
VFEELVGAAPSLREALSRLSMVAPTDATVLITGETGTGKELVARAIHRRSRRAGRPFVSVNCAAIPASLIASELFGHERGAFTGALQRRLGRFELAAGGTLFLDEVGELPLETQIALLRVLQEREFERVGGTRPIHADVRVIAATNRDLQEAVDAGTFRSDLFYRLNVFPIEVPPLRERRGDVRVLVEHFARRHAAALGKTVRRISRKTLDLLEGYPWPGNVRELQNIVERSLIVCDSDTLLVDETWLPSSRRIATGAGESVATTLDGVKRAHVLRVLEETNWTLGGPSGAAVRLGLKRTTLQSLLKRLGLQAPMSPVRAAV